MLQRNGECYDVFEGEHGDQRQRPMDSSGWIEFIRVVLSLTNMQSGIDKATVCQRAANVVHADVSAIVCGKVRIVAPVDGIQTFRYGVMRLLDDNPVSTNITHVRELLHK